MEIGQAILELLVTLSLSLQNQTRFYYILLFYLSTWYKFFILSIFSCSELFNKSK